MVCPYCTSMYVKKDGKKFNKGTTNQKFKCNSCSKNFSVPYETSIPDEYPSVKPGEIFTIKSKEKLRIHCLTDVHVGAVEFDLKKFKEAVRMIKRDRNARWFGNGDLLELIPPGYKAINQRGQNIPPDEQYLAFLKLVEPIKDKCLFIRGGNHDFLRSYTILDFDVCKTLAAEMNVPYFQYPGYTSVDIAGSVWNIVSGHGKSGAKNGDLELDKLSSVYSDGDVFILGHNHQLYAKPVDSIKIVDGEESLRRRWYVRGGSFLRYANYARYSMYPIIRTGWVTTELTKEGIKCWEN
jgi:predicted phosphodiesterase